MGKSTRVGWVSRPLPNGTLIPGHTVNPWWGCVKIAPECKSCYAEAISHHYRKDVWGSRQLLRGGPLEENTGRSRFSGIVRPNGKDTVGASFAHQWQMSTKSIA